MWRTLICGMCMGAADIVPGISGGTIAFIMGFYSQLIDSIKNPRSRESLKFLAFLISGILIAFITLAHFFDFILGHEIYRVFLYASFLGLIAASVIFCAKQLEQWLWIDFGSLISGAIIAFFLTGTSFQPTISEPVFDVYIPVAAFRTLENYDPVHQKILSVPESSVGAMLAKGTITPETHVYSHAEERIGSVEELVNTHTKPILNIWLIICGTIAISAMLLPGVSGSYLLTILGAYSLAIGAVADMVAALKTFSFDMDAALVLTNLFIGIVIGGLLFSRLVSWLLKNYRNITIAMLTGFMLGALRSVWPFWTYRYYVNPLKLDKGPLLQIVNPVMPDASSAIFYIALMFMVVGFGLVFLVEMFAQKGQPYRAGTS